MKNKVEEKMLEKLIFTIVLVSMFLFQTDVVNAAWNILQLTDNTTDDKQNQINASGLVVWVGRGGTDDGSDYEIFTYENGIISQLTTNSYDDTDPEINDSGEIVWKGFIKDQTSGKNAEIFYFNGTTTEQLTDNDDKDKSPNINNNGDIGWTGGIDPANSEVYYYDGSNIVWQTSNAIPDSGFRINDNGQATWLRYTGSDYEIMYFDGTSTIQLSTDSIGDNEKPRINNLGHVVWTGINLFSNNSDIYYWDGSSIIRITINSYNDSDAVISDSGHIAWKGEGNIGNDTSTTDSEIFLYYKGVTQQITINSNGEDDDPEINASGNIVWEGAGGSDGGSDYELFYYDGSNVTQLTENSCDDENGMISENNHIVWEGAAITVCSEREIFIASSALPVFSKQFSHDQIIEGGTTTLTYTIDNSANIIEANTLAFIDTLTTGLVVSAAPNDNSTCTGGTLTAVAGTGTISYTNGTVSASGSCTIAVDITGNEVGSLVNTSGVLSSNFGNSGTTTATLEVLLDTDGDGTADINDDDDDGDGMTDIWEIANNLAPLDSNDAALDPDRDGMTNLTEFKLGLDPNDGSDCPSWMCTSSKIWLYKQFKNP